jgi:hypothetical protein
MIPRRPSEYLNSQNTNENSLKSFKKKTFDKLLERMELRRNNSGDYCEHLIK